MTHVSRITSPLVENKTAAKFGIWIAANKQKWGNDRCLNPYVGLLGLGLGLHGVGKMVPFKQVIDLNWVYKTKAAVIWYCLGKVCFSQALNSKFPQFPQNICQPSLWYILSSPIQSL